MASDTKEEVQHGAEGSLLYKVATRWAAVKAEVWKVACGWRRAPAVHPRTKDLPAEAAEADPEVVTVRRVLNVWRGLSYVLILACVGARPSSAQDRAASKRCSESDTCACALPS